MDNLQSPVVFVTIKKLTEKCCAFVLPYFGHKKIHTQTGVAKQIQNVTARWEQDTDLRKSGLPGLPVRSNGASYSCTFLLSLDSVFSIVKERRNCKRENH